MRLRTALLFALFLLVLTYRVCAQAPLPERFLYQGQTWQVIYVHHEITACGDLRGSFVGCTSCKARTVKIVDMRSWNEIASTLRHEVMHVVTDCSDGAMTLHQAIYDLSEKMQGFEHQNPEYVTYVTTPPLKLTKWDRLKLWSEDGLKQHSIMSGTPGKETK